MASCTATKEAVWLSRLVADMHGTSAKRVIISPENQGAVDTTRYQAIVQRYKHVNIQSYYVRDMIEPNSKDFRYCHPVITAARILRKSLDRA